MTAGWCSRTTRAALFAAVSVLLAALGHVLMSGRHVPAWALAAGVAAAGAAGWCLAGRERGLPLIVTVVVAAQTALHSAFSLAQSAPGGTGSGAGVNSMGMGAMGGGPMARSHMGAAPMGVGHIDRGHMDSGHVGHLGLSAADTPSYGMLTAHLLAALLCGLWLAHGERAAFRVLRAVAARLAAPLRLLRALPGAPDRPRPRVRRSRSDRAPRRRLLVHAITSRGPPTGTAVA
ncbi:hypothetical protein ABZ922_37785 [Streptomyces shenzhenensis]|uniref:hypothetical protein n=1 Tax=Streptomyces shenzhenensis TaxID=943815 RepID=UPI0034045F79